MQVHDVRRFRHEMRRDVRRKTLGLLWGRQAYDFALDSRNHNPLGRFLRRIQAWGDSRQHKRWRILRLSHAEGLYNAARILSHRNDGRMVLSDRDVNQITFSKNTP